jgi:hypothetical protein
MKEAQLDLSPDDLNSEEVRIQRIVEWWSEFRVCGDPGAATWEELDGLEQEVTDCLAERPPGLNRAESLTAYAMLLIAGCTEL